MGTAQESGERVDLRRDQVSVREAAAGSHEEPTGSGTRVDHPDGGSLPVRPGDHCVHDGLGRIRRAVAASDLRTPESAERVAEGILTAVKKPPRIIDPGRGGARRPREQGLLGRGQVSPARGTQGRGEAGELALRGD
jgi:hypothetical protein